MERYAQIFNMALDAVFANKFRSMLTALGIIFGVAAVISMMAIGRGAQKEILDQMKLVGVNNIVIMPVNKGDKKKQESQSSDNSNSSSSNGKKAAEKFSPGLSLRDAEAIRQILPTVARVSPEVGYDAPAACGDKSIDSRLIGVTNDFFGIFNLEMEKGSAFSALDQEKGQAVCILGAGVAARLFTDSDPIGQTVKVGGVWLTVVGVIKGMSVNSNATENLGINDYNAQVFTPLSTVFLRIKDRSLITKANISGGGFDGGDFFVMTSDDNSKAQYNQLDKIVVQVKESEALAATADVIKRMLLRKHASVEDFDVKVPELLLKQEQRTKDIFNIVLGAIASISLLVGGIGIMNIMLASVMERIREIGVRLAIGARRKDIILQFLTEATLISLSGGFAGIVLGIVLAKLITQFADILTIISPLSILISFGVSAAVGISFGYMPARKAAEQDPVTSLRHE